MKKDNLIVGIILGITIIAASTNPKPYRHKELLKTKLYSGLEQSGTDKIPGTDESQGKICGGMKTLLKKEMINQLVENDVSTKSYGVFSTTSITIDRKTKVIGVGIFGFVFYTSEFDETFKEGILNGQE
ncbi:MAG: DUF4359 domain-containing protein [Paludibacter sp.]